MKRSEADFRPKRRAGYVPSPPRKRIPLLRILLLLAAAGLVYRHFDSFWPRLRAWAHLPLHRDALGDGRLSSAWSFSDDSTRAVLRAGKSDEAEVCRVMETLREGLCPQARAALAKARWLGALRKPVLSQVHVSLSRSEKQSAQVMVLEGRDSAVSFRYERSNSSSPWCDSTRGCLSLPAPRTPVAQGASQVFPVLAGTVLRADSLGPSHYRVVLYHGRELYTTYEPLRRLAEGVADGAPVDPLHSIGEIAPRDSSHSGLAFHVTQAGMPVDPAEFLAAEGSHGP